MNKDNKNPEYTHLYNIHNSYYEQKDYVIVICPCRTKIFLNKSDFLEICNKYECAEIYIDTKDNVAKIRKFKTKSKVYIVLERAIFGPRYSYKPFKTDFRHEERKPTYENWKIEPDGITLATISSCITDNKQQTMQELILHVADIKNAPVEESEMFLEKLYSEGRLGYYEYDSEEKDYIFRKWVPSDRKE